jgi:hypothetical protein
MLLSVTKSGRFKRKCVCYIYCALPTGLRNIVGPKHALHSVHDTQYQARNELYTDSTVCNKYITPGGVGVLCVNQITIDTVFLRPHRKMCFFALLGRYRHS